ASVYLLVFIRNLLVHLGEKILLIQPLKNGGDYHLLTSIRLIPVEGKVVLELVGELAGLLSLGGQNEQSRACGAAGSTKLVAGARIGHCFIPSVRHTHLQIAQPKTDPTNLTADTLQRRSLTS
ncbi:hypothetical protein NX862_19180, partial [Rhodobacter sp. KR11]|uniref:hypothetical protein n=1 Tax=Rhodobacter sp. KR11 TaxID=2974588 RepID=UPI002222BFC7